MLRSNIYGLLGTVIGEMVRLTMLCSLKQMYGPPMQHCILLMFYVKGPPILPQYALAWIAPPLKAIGSMGPIAHLASPMQSTRSNIKAVQHLNTGQTWQIFGVATTGLPALASPKERLMARPPGQMRSGPSRPMPAVVACPSSPPAASVRVRSAALSSSRWLPLTYPG